MASFFKLIKFDKTYHFLIGKEHTYGISRAETCSFTKN